MSIFQIQTTLDDFALAAVAEGNIFQNKRDIEAFVRYPNTGVGILKLTYAKVEILSVCYFPLFSLVLKHLVVI